MVSYLIIKLSNWETFESWLDGQSPSWVSMVAISSLESWGMLVRRSSIALSFDISLVDLIPMLILSF